MLDDMADFYPPAKAKFEAGFPAAGAKPR